VIDVEEAGFIQKKIKREWKNTAAATAKRAQRIVILKKARRL